ncbi:hypothetical protein NA57DRAFT_73671 [Rhizodiscina lignyota]|uniref:Inheritance of peroxisomes protein 1 n=1 Tax=Rhizodiscina lignyota TaxID=1504668 RepID=A0A9P4IJF8_9PEZI|nr:hypothetical protein NA57DRAFT_73671 [Rhizodiscina lignyota]
MSAISSPSTPETPAPRIRPVSLRSSTVPTKLIEGHSTSSPTSATGTVGTDKDLEILFAHVSGKIVSFTTSSSTSRPSSSSSRGTAADKDVIGTLPWASPTERTVAAGPLQIYRVRSSGVAFLHSGRLLHPIMPASQCWCVDGESKFVLRVRDGVFYRLELPWDTEDDKTKVEEFKDVLGKVLRYERTACPFNRGFHVDLPEESLDSPTRVRILRNTSRAKRWKLKGVWVPEDGRPQMTTAEDRRPSETSQDSNGEGTESSNSVDDDPREESSGVAAKPQEQAVAGAEPERKDSIDVSESPIIQPSRPRTIVAIRSVTAPPHLITSTSPPSVAPPSPEDITEQDADTRSIASSRASYHTADDSDSPLSTSGPYEDALPTPGPEISNTIDLSNSGKGHHARDVSDVTITGSDDTDGVAESSKRHSFPSPPSTPTLICDMDDVGDPPWSDAVTPPNTLRLRRLPKAQARGRDGAQAAPYTPIFSPTSPTRGRRLTAAILQKAYSIILGPPASLVALMLRIAAKIANGANIWYSYDLRGHGERMAGTWESTDEEDAWDEDDFGVPLSNTKSRGSSVTDGESPGAASRRQEVD